MIAGRYVLCDEYQCTATVPNNKFERIRAQDGGWFFSFKEGTAWCPKHKPDWVEEWRASRKENLTAEYLALEKRVKAGGMPVGGDASPVVRAVAAEPEALCQSCGRLELTMRVPSRAELDDEVQRHVRETGHTVVAGIWMGVIYGPER